MLGARTHVLALSVGRPTLPKRDLLRESSFTFLTQFVVALPSHGEEAVTAPQHLLPHGEGTWAPPLQKSSFQFTFPQCSG